MSNSVTVAPCLSSYTTKSHRKTIRLSGVDITHAQEHDAEVLSGGVEILHAREHDAEVLSGDERIHSREQHDAKVESSSPLLLDFTSKSSYHDVDFLREYVFIDSADMPCADYWPTRRNLHENLWVNL